MPAKPVLADLLLLSWGPSPVQQQPAAPITCSALLTPLPSVPLPLPFVSFGDGHWPSASTELRAPWKRLCPSVCPLRLPRDACLLSVKLPVSGLYCPHPVHPPWLFPSKDGVLKASGIWKGSPTMFHGSRDIISPSPLLEALVTIHSNLFFK